MSHRETLSPTRYYLDGGVVASHVEIIGGPRDGESAVGIVDTNEEDRAVLLMLSPQMARTVAAQLVGFAEAIERNQCPDE